MDLQEHGFLAGLGAALDLRCRGWHRQGKGMWVGAWRHRRINVSQGTDDWVLVVVSVGAAVRCFFSPGPCGLAL